MYSFAEQIIRQAFFLSVWGIERFHDMAPYHRKVAALSQLPAGTVGKELADCLLTRNLTLIPGFESHDLKHVVLDYELEPVGEIRLQAFMLGNGNWTLPSFAIFLFGLLLLPRQWRKFLQDFRAGRQCISLSSLEIDHCQHESLTGFRARLSSRYTEIKPTMKPAILHRRISYLGSYSLMIIGAAAMLFCFPFLWSANVADLVGAGFPFVAGAILVVGGLISLTLHTAPQTETTQA
ncbi:hypothetical protein [Hymenobacter perfusus]|uniref:Uncharacterized protein n=1 Tax=Hymenobacter perfusus TaxID=1236770 RepID=A0A3R9PQC5_9BACT|nr:hypothetical protein [Hymenobacter perfusus]RSK43589.1 hypothetical protein EI293_11935 [Hymenobacter perfusus]